MKRRLLSSFSFLLGLSPVTSFLSTAFLVRNPKNFRLLPLLSSHTADLLLEALECDPKDENQVAACISALEASRDNPQSAIQDEEADFDPLLGLYEVSYVKTQRPNDNPVGGKWTRRNGIAQKLLNTRRSFQHILPVNNTGFGSLFGEGRKCVGEAVNVISLEALFGRLRLTVILRGDVIPLTNAEPTNTTRVVQPLSSLAVKALFDAPRIVVGKKGSWLNLNVGPKTSVLLDTLFCDDKIRLGMGGTSGSRFVFRRCAADDEEANEFRGLMTKPMKKANCLAFLGAVALAGSFAVVRGYARVLSGTTATMALAVGALIAFSGGGVEEDGMGVTVAKEMDAAAPAFS